MELDWPGGLGPEDGDHNGYSNEDVDVDVDLDLDVDVDEDDEEEKGEQDHKHFYDGIGEVPLRHQAPHVDLDEFEDGMTL